MTVPRTGRTITDDAAAVVKEMDETLSKIIALIPSLLHDDAETLAEAAWYAGHLPGTVPGSIEAIPAPLLEYVVRLWAPYPLPSKEWRKRVAVAAYVDEVRDRKLNELASLLTYAAHLATEVGILPQAPRIVGITADGPVPIELERMSAVIEQLVTMWGVPDIFAPEVLEAETVARYGVLVAQANALTRRVEDRAADLLERLDDDIITWGWGTIGDSYLYTLPEYIKSKLGLVGYFTLSPELAARRDAVFTDAFRLRLEGIRFEVAAGGAPTLTASEVESLRVVDEFVGANIEEYTRAQALRAALTIPTHDKMSLMDFALAFGVTPIGQVGVQLAWQEGTAARVLTPATMQRLLSVPSRSMLEENILRAFKERLLPMRQLLRPSGRLSVSVADSRRIYQSLLVRAQSAETGARGGLHSILDDMANRFLDGQIEEHHVAGVARNIARTLTSRGSFGLPSRLAEIEEFMAADVGAVRRGVYLPAPGAPLGAAPMRAALNEFANPIADALDEALTRINGASGLAARLEAAGIHLTEASVGRAMRTWDDFRVAIRETRRALNAALERPDTVTARELLNRAREARNLWGNVTREIAESPGVDLSKLGQEGFTAWRVDADAAHEALRALVRDAEAAQTAIQRLSTEVAPERLAVLDRLLPERAIPEIPDGAFPGATQTADAATRVADARLRVAGDRLADLAESVDEITVGLGDPVTGPSAVSIDAALRDVAAARVSGSIDSLTAAAQTVRTTAASIDAAAQRSRQILGEFVPVEPGRGTTLARARTQVEALVMAGKDLTTVADEMAGIASGKAQPARGAAASKIPTPAEVGASSVVREQARVAEEVLKTQVPAGPVAAAVEAEIGAADAVKPAFTDPAPAARVEAVTKQPIRSTQRPNGTLPRSAVKTAKTYLLHQEAMAGEVVTGMRARVDAQTAAARGDRAGFLRALKQAEASALRVLTFGSSLGQRAPVMSRVVVYGTIGLGIARTIALTGLGATQADVVIWGPGQAAAWNGNDVNLGPLFRSGGAYGTKRLRDDMNSFIGISDMAELALKLGRPDLAEVHVSILRRKIAAFNGAIQQFRPSASETGFLSQVETELDKHIAAADTLDIAIAKSREQGARTGDARLSRASGPASVGQLALLRRLARGRAGLTDEQKARVASGEISSIEASGLIDQLQGTPAQGAPTPKVNQPTATFER